MFWNVFRCVSYLEQVKWKVTCEWKLLCLGMCDGYLEHVRLDPTGLGVMSNLNHMKPEWTLMSKSKLMCLGVTGFVSVLEYVCHSVSVCDHYLHSYCASGFSFTPSAKRVSNLILFKWYV